MIWIVGHVTNSQNGLLRWFFFVRPRNWGDATPKKMEKTWGNFCSSTLPETNSKSPWKMDGWFRWISFWGPGTYSQRRSVSFREGLKKIKGPLFVLISAQHFYINLWMIFKGGVSVKGRIIWIIWLFNSGDQRGNPKFNPFNGPNSLKFHDSLICFVSNHLKKSSRF